MTEGCCNAFIQCDTKGLEPCAICCGGQAKAIPGHGAGGMGAGAGTSVGTGEGSYSTDGDSTPITHSDLSEMVGLLRKLVEEVNQPSVASRPMPQAASTEIITHMLSMGVIGSVDFDPSTGVMSFKVDATQLPKGGAGVASEPRQRPQSRQRDYGQTDTRDVVREISNGTHNSLERYLRPDGTLTPEREEVHRQIIDQMLRDKVPVQGQATFRMLGGGPASGKSSVVKGGCVEVMAKENTLDVDSDAVKEMLPGYADMAAATPEAAAFFHEEASALAKRVMGVAMRENYNVTLDGTGNGSVASVRGKIAQARRAGYKVSAVYVTVDIDTAIERNKQRYRRQIAQGKNPRLVPARVVVNIHKSVSAILPEVAADFDEVELYDNSGPRGSKPTLIARGGSGEPLMPMPGRERELIDFMHKR